MNATVDDGVFLADDLARDTRWPGFSARTVAAIPVRSVLSLTINPDPPRAALNLYGGHPRVFTPDSVDSATVFAAHAHMLLMYLGAADKVRHLDRALTTSRLIGTAIGILMFAHKISEQEAFDRLTRASQNLNRKLTDIADHVTQTGTLPTNQQGKPTRSG